MQPLHRGRRRPVRDPTLDPSDELASFDLVAHATDCRDGHQGPVAPLSSLAALRKLPLISALNGSAHAGADERGGFHEDRAKQAARFTVHEPDATRSDPKVVWAGGGGSVLINGFAIGSLDPHPDLIIGSGVAPGADG